MSALLDPADFTGLLADALASVTSAGGEITIGDGLDVSIVSMLTDAQVRRYSVDPEFRAQVDAVADGTARRMLTTARALSRQTYDTGRFYSGWRVERRGAGRLRLHLVNPTPYAAWVRRRGQDEPVVDRYIRPAVDALRARARREIARIRPGVAPAPVPPGLPAVLPLGTLGVQFLDRLNEAIQRRLAARVAARRAA